MYIEPRVHTMTLYKYFKSELACRSQANEYLTVRDIESANKKVKAEVAKTEMPPEKKRKVYATYTAEERASIGWYSSKHGPMGASQYFTKNLVAQYPRHLHDALRKNIYRSLKRTLVQQKFRKKLKSYLLSIKEGPFCSKKELIELCRSILTHSVQMVVPVNICIVMAAEAIICTQHPGYLQEQGGSFVVTKTWTKSLLIQMNFVKKKFQCRKNAS